ncbi:HpaII family restriction endonuclease [Porphyromonas sp.]|uniref:HpaII family restriction endonuclease n=1 Tax=Porphyromonas sp. TaxID=1924944 RepID=UPI0026DC7B06|nr:HpaII family restriction endonuclease [Porphyromonas sp.]MDO4771187.1 HpaII family restriction endonuclease [Porphyromonas sp.]
MALKGNKGELSELYTFFKLLGDGRLHCGDGELNRYDDRYYPILKIFRDDAIDRNTYEIQSTESSILVTGKNIPDTFPPIPQKDFRQAAETLIKYIKDKEQNADMSHLESFMEIIDIHDIKSKSSDKADIRIVIHNLNTGSKPELGYSIKSRLGAASTLINSNGDGTNFIFRVQGITTEQVKTFNTFDRFKKKFDYLESIRASIAYYRTANRVLHNNLTLLDLGIEKVIAESLRYYYSGKGRDLDEITKHITVADPLNISGDTDQPMYAYKVKQFLLAFALGMTCSKPWYGNFHANGGYIVVKEDGDIVCYHFFDRNDLEDYLFSNTRFETPSISRHDFGKIYQEDGEFFLKLNLQIRFK